MPKRSIPRDNGLPILVLDIEPAKQVEHQQAKPKLRQPYGIGNESLRISAYHNRHLPRPNRHFPSMFGPGGGYTDSSWI